VNFNYFISETVFRYIVEAVAIIAEFGWNLLPQYRFDAASGRWNHRDGSVEPPMRLGDLAYGGDGRLTYPHHDSRAPESQLLDTLDWARTYVQSLRDWADEAAAADLGPEFEHLRWFELPAECVSEPAP